MIILGLIVLILLILLSSYFFVKKNHLWTEPSKTNLNNTIDNSNFFHRMNNADLKARGFSSSEEYKKFYKKSISHFSNKEAKKLDLLIKKASYVLNNYENISRIPWKIVKSSKIEEGMPHTIGDIIVLSEMFFEKNESKQLETIIHEKIHVYQRTHPIETSKLLVSIGFKHWKQGRSVPLLRNNPDNDSSVYSLGGIAQAQVYSSENPGSITDSDIKTLEGNGTWDFPVQQKEHPYEIMACWVSSELLSAHETEHAHKKKIRSWMKEFL